MVSNIPVTKLEYVPAMGRVRVTAEYPHPNQAGWTKVEYYVPVGATPAIGSSVKVTIGD